MPNTSDIETSLVEFDALGSQSWESEQQTIDAGRKLAAFLPAGSAVALIGELGAGKTHFCKGLAQGWCGTNPSQVRSPTFTLIHSYSGNGRRLFHADLCRVTSAMDVPSDVIDALAATDSIVAIEWAELFPDIWPPKTLVIEIGHGVASGERVVRAWSRGLNASALVEWLRESGHGREASSDPRSPK